jgi:hypothetical protein
MSLASIRALRGRGAGPQFGGLVAGAEPQLPTLPDPPYPAGQVHPALPVPPGEQLVEAGDVPRRQRARRAARRDRGGAEHPGAQRGGQRREGVGADRRAWRRQPFGSLLGQLIQRVRVRAELSRGARQRLGDAGSERGLQGGQRVMTDPSPRVPAVGVVRVVPGAQAQRRAGRPRPVPADGQERPAVHAGPLGHAGQGAAAGPAGQPEQHRLGLVVERVAEQHGRGSRLLAAVA